MNKYTEEFTNVFETYGYNGFVIHVRELTERHWKNFDELKMVRDAADFVLENQ